MEILCLCTKSNGVVRPSLIVIRIRVDNDTDYETEFLHFSRRPGKIKKVSPLKINTHKPFFDHH